MDYRDNLNGKEYKHDISNFRIVVTEAIKRLIVKYGFNDATNNTDDNYIPLSDGGIKYDGIYVMPKHSIAADGFKRAITSAYIYKTHEMDADSGYVFTNVGFTCSDMENDLCAQELSLDDLVEVYGFINELVQNKEDYETCHKWYTNESEEW